MRTDLTATSTSTTSTPTETPTDEPLGGNVSSESGLSDKAGESAVDAANWVLDRFLNWGIPLDVAKLLLALLVLGIAWYASEFITQFLGRRVTRRFRRPSVSRTILRIIRMSVLGVGVLFIVGYIYRISLGNIVLSVTVFSATIGIVLAPLVGSLISGLFVLADQPYEVGDMIELVDTDQRGFVEDITIRYTKIFTLDNTFLVIPNGSMRERDVINYSAEDTRTRFSLDIGVTYESDVEKARTLIEKAARGVDGVITGGPDIRVGSSRYPAAPTCLIDEFGGSSVEFTLRYWVKNPYQPRVMRSRIKTEIWEQLDDTDIEMAYPHTHIVFDETSGELNVNVSERTHSEEQPNPRPPVPETND